MKSGQPLILQPKVQECKRSPSSAEFPQIRNYSTRYGEAKRFSCSTSHVFKDSGPEAGGGIAIGKKARLYESHIFIYGSYFYIKL